MEDGLIKVVAPIGRHPGAQGPGHHGQRHHHRISTASRLQGLTPQPGGRQDGAAFPNTGIKLTIMRKRARDKPIEIPIIRDIIQVRAVRSNINGDDVGYVRITQFGERDHGRALRKSDDRDVQSSRRQSSRASSSTLRNNPGAGCSTRRSRCPARFLERGENRLDPAARTAEETQRFKRARRRPQQGQARSSC